MKNKILIVLCFTLFMSSNFYSQTVNDIPLKDIKVDYIQIVGTSKMFSSKLTINLDFGQRDKLFNAKDTQLRDEDGKLLDFNSMIDALNFFSMNGYEFADAYAITISNKNVYHFLLKKKKIK